MATMTAQSLVAFCLFSLIYTASAASDGVPVMIWSNKELTDLPDAMMGHTTPSNTFHTDYIKKLVQGQQQTLLVFMQDKLSLEDITRYADVYSEDSDGAAFHNLKHLLEDSSQSSQLPSVSSPSAALAKLRQDFVGRVHSLSAPYSLNDLDLDDKQNNLVVVNLPQTKTSDEGFHDSLKYIDSIIGSVSTDMDKKKIPYAAIYTAEKSSRLHPDSQYVGRHLLAEAAEDSYTLFNVTNSTGFEWLLFYARNITIQLCETTPEDPEKPCQAMVDLAPKNELDVDLTYENTEISIVWSYAAAEIPADFESITFNLTFRGREARRFWHFSNMTVTFKPTGGTEETIPLATSHIEAAYRHSYHCTSEGPLYERKPVKNRKTVKVRFLGFQVQYGQLKDGKFGLPNDCVGFFSIGVWMGLTTAFVLTSILAFGIVMIMNISTQDRFDDPKGKTISVTAQE